MSRPYFFTHLDHILDLDTIWVLLGILVPKNTWRATSWSHLSVQRSFVKVSASKILAIERRYRIGGFFRPKKVWWFPWGGAGWSFRKRMNQILGNSSTAGTTHQKLLIAEIHPNLDCCGMPVTTHLLVIERAVSVENLQCLMSMFFLAGDTVIHCSLYPMMIGNKMSDTTVNLRGSSKTMSLALALPIKMGRNITHYLYQLQCSHVQTGYTAHVQTHPKIRSNWWHLSNENIPIVPTLYH